MAVASMGTGARARAPRPPPEHPGGLCAAGRNHRPGLPDPDAQGFAGQRAGAGCRARRPQAAL